MSYRMLGRTGLMVSEFVCGGDPIRLDNIRPLDLATELGLNYFDMAPAYGRGECEQAYGKWLGGSSSRRDKVFLATKVSGFSELRNRLYREIFDTLPADRQETIRKRAEALIAERGVLKPGYYFTYFPGQPNQVPPSYLATAMMSDYAHKVEGSRKFREFMITSVEGSLKRLGTDHVDVLLCPHGSCSPEEMEIPEIHETFLSLRKQGKVRFLGVSSHTDPAGILRAITRLGTHDMIMCAYNVLNGAALDEPIRQAAAKGIGVIAMKVAMSVATQHKELQPIPQWRIDMINRIVPGEMKPPVKAYLWALQNPLITAVNSNLTDETRIRENFEAIGKRVDLQPA
jgi:aryl-alcohol dehydrogenase-like predicted oxidoreductase